MRQLESARRQTLRSLEADEDYSDAQKDRVRAALDAAYEVDKIVIEFQREAEIEREIGGIADERHAASMEALHVQADLADTEAERKRLALAIFDAEEDYLASKLRAIELSETANDYERERASIALAGLEASRAGRRASVSRANETELERWLRNANKSPDQMGEARTGIGLDGLDRLADGLSRIAGEAKSVGDAFKMMRDVFQGVIQDMLAQLVRLQLQKALAGIMSSIAGGVGGGAPVNLLAGIPGYAKGTNFHPGGLASVGEEGRELLNLPRGSQVISNHELRSLGAHSQGDGTKVYMTVNTPDADSFRRSENQIARDLRRKLNGSVR